jgi:hypothetical protein
MRSFNKIWIPSAGKLCKFNEITHQQEKVILKSIAQQAGAYSSFMFALSEIMANNTIDAANFNVIDRLFYGIYTKAYCFGNDLDYILKCSDCSKSIKYSVNLQNAVNAVGYLSTNKEVKRIYDDWAFVISAPSLQRDVLLRELKESDIFDDETNNILETLSYVKKIAYRGYDIDFEELTPEQSLEFFNNMDHHIGESLLAHVDEFQSNLYGVESEDALIDLNCVCGSKLLYFALNSVSFDSFLAMIYNGELNTLYQKELNYRTLFPGSDIDLIAPIERDLLISMKNNANQQSETDGNSSGEIDLAKM